MAKNVQNMLKIALEGDKELKNLCAQLPTRSEGGVTVLEATDFLVDEVTITAIPAFAEAWMGLKLPDPSDATGYTSVARARLEMERFPDRTRQALKLEQLRFDELQLGLLASDLTT